jgi:hypothetical protein
VKFEASALSVMQGSPVTLMWSTTHADVCFASGSSAWSAQVATSGSAVLYPSATTTYTLACGNVQGTTTEVRSVGVTESVNVGGTVRITEVLFNPNAERNQGNNTNNEWIELYNASAHAVDFAGWKFRDETATDTISVDPLVVPAGGYLIITRATSTATYWTYGVGAHVVHLLNPLGNGLGNEGDSIVLLDTEGAVVDAVSWGVSKNPALVPAVSTAEMPAGHSLERTNRLIDTDTAEDWMWQENPTPGN